MQFVESVKVTDPVSGRKCTVIISEDEITMLLTVGINTLLTQGLISLIQQEDGMHTVMPEGETMQ